MAVFDTGLDAGSHDFGNVVEQINWTNEDSLTDGVGHGTHIAGNKLLFRAFTCCIDPFGICYQHFFFFLCGMRFLQGFRRENVQNTHTPYLLSPSKLLLRAFTCYIDPFGIYYQHIVFFHAACGFCMVSEGKMFKTHTPYLLSPSPLSSEKKTSEYISSE